MKKVQKLQVTLNEVTRMQKLAGIIPLYESNEGLLTEKFVSSNRKKDFVNKALCESCWSGYQQDGMKNKGRKQVPNCVLKKSGIKEIAVSRKGVKLFHKDFKSALEAVVNYAKKRGYDVNKNEAEAKGDTIDRPNRIGNYFETYINLKKNGKIQPNHLVFGAMYTKPSNLNPVSQVRINFDIKKVNNLEYDSTRRDDLTPEELAKYEKDAKAGWDYFHAPMTAKKKPSFLSRVFGKK